MNKDSILEKSRKENVDEGMQQAENRGRQLGIISFSAVFIFILIFSRINGADAYAPFSMFWAFTAVEAYPKYRFTQKKSYLVTTIAGAVFTIFYLVSYVSSVSR